MPDPRYPAAVWRPGINADNGHTSMTSVVCHYTVGRDSRPVGDRGYFHFLVSRDGTVTQFARANAICWHAGDPWNARGPGIEVEYLDEPTIFTPEADAAAGLLVSWLHSEWGVPLDFYDGARRTEWAGFITHRSLIQSGDAHSDYWPYLPIGDDMAEADLTLKALNDVRNVVGGDKNLDGSAPTIGQLVRDVAAARAEIAALAKKIDALTVGAGAPTTLKVELSGTATP